ncbi:MAG: hypothetical protein DHS20C19_04550 [Acidimicrobiales bacterium]|nr:MAG: hypothetical protein DHS20C19_04550 [Acidimicrobiales bacterium]
MSFGQSAGPPATGRQVEELRELLRNAGHADFRDARGPMGFNQRQAGGRFTADEAAELIDQLLAAEHEAAQSAEPEPKAKAKAKAAKKSANAAEKASSDTPAADLTEHEIAIRTAPTKALVLEVRRRGWTVTRKTR